eukprot:TRINITY_DN72402_c0_g1_i1.p1 TRINITY_DN72402_c0_g1~~TRINITY_DN72402_c0_g1_i1.p1  ORF type:complete len:444 (+),score=44.07 TRINITY_DN72402_c0_g1_i1:79-1410(+)
MTIVILIIGPPCVGKTTLANGLSERLGLVHVSASSLFRSLEIENRSNERMQLELVLARIRKPDCFSGFILDNFPRSENQAQSLQSFGISVSEVVTCVLDLEASSQDVEARAAVRLVHRDTGLPAPSARSQEPEPETECSGLLAAAARSQEPEAEPENRTLAREPGGDVNMLMRRSGDSPERFRERLLRYAENIHGLRRFFESQSVPVVHLDGTQPRPQLLQRALLGINSSRDRARIDDPRDSFGASQGPVNGPVGQRELLEKLDLSRTWITEVEFKLVGLEEILNSWIRESENSNNWEIVTECKECGCQTTTSRYIGRSCEIDRSVLEEMKDLIQKSIAAIDEGQSIHVYLETKDLSIVGKCCFWFFICCNLNPIAGRLQSRLTKVKTRVSAFEASLSRARIARTATRTNQSVLCEFHRPVQIASRGRGGRSGHDDHDDGNDS